MSRINVTIDGVKHEINSSLPEDINKIKNAKPAFGGGILRDGQNKKGKLSESFLKRVHAVWKEFSQLNLIGSKEKFEANFLLESNPERELQIWENIAYFYYRFHEKYTDFKFMILDKEKKLLAELIGFSTGNHHQPIFGQEIEEMQIEIIEEAKKRKTL